MSTQWADPLWFGVVLLLVLRVWLAIGDTRRGRFAFRFSSLQLVDTARAKAGPTRWIPFTLELAGLILVIIALARPQWVETSENQREGIDIAIVLDASGSMAAEDFRPDNRFAVARRLVSEFIDQRTDDRIGIVTFGSRAATRAPVSFDRDIARMSLAAAQIGENGDGTAIGQAVATAVNRLRPSKTESRVIILLTDGVNNSGTVDPNTAAELAAALGIRVYTIGVGSLGPVPVPVRFQDPFTNQIRTRYQYIRADLDEEILKRMAEVTGGHYFRATDSEALEAVLDRIDELERSELEAPEHYRVEDRYFRPLTWGLALLFISALSGNTLWIRIPS
ncbi:MAG: VWA domain-containing protein [Acidobacteria bacterium]|nr:VWA domain-containing protein [Acidobacteriota bacterium]